LPSSLSRDSIGQSFNLQEESRLVVTASLLVFSHLRWDFVYQRPQHLLSRLARARRVLFIEEPVLEEGAGARLDVSSPCRNAQVVRPVTGVRAPGFNDDQMPHVARMLPELLERERIGEHLAWLYTPMALPLLDVLSPRAVLYDCMDELSAFRGAPAEMRQREAALLRRADLVLTGGPSLYEAKRALHANVHCVPSSVDAAHYAPDGAAATGPQAAEARRLMAGVPAPRLGYFGVIDERLDLDLLAALADASTGWQVVMVGPVVKVDPSLLPRRPNLHWLGQQPYERLPALAAQWDVCLLPFALNEHTRYISPTKTLEYLAAQRAVVSTPVKDVVDLYGPAVEIAHGPAGFVAACARALTEPPGARARRLATAVTMVAKYSWDETAHRVSRLIDMALQRERQAHEAQPRTEGAA
jgi:glycosyltransferase involved in cell wall biosynthesis